MRKYMFSAIVALPMSWLVEVMKYVYQDWEFAKWIAMAVVLDTVLGIAKAWIEKDISSEEFWNKFGKKMLGYISLMILSNILQHYTVNGSTVGATEWMGDYLCTYMLIREGVSVLDEYYWLNKADPNYSLCRATVNRGEDVDKPRNLAKSVTVE